MTNNCFFSPSGLEKASFKGGSIIPLIPESSEAEVIACFAAAVHSLRTGGLPGQSKLGVNFPLYTIIKVQDYLGNTFNEALIKSAIIRSAGFSELYAVDDVLLQTQKERILGFINGEHLTERETCFFLYELFLAIKLNKLPKPNMDKKLRELLQ